MKTDAYNRQQHLKMLFRKKEFAACNVFLATYPKDVVLKKLFEKLSNSVEDALIKEEWSETCCRNNHVRQLSYILKKTAKNPTRYTDRVQVAKVYAKENGVQTELVKILNEKAEWFKGNVAQNKQPTPAKVKSKRELVNHLEELIASGKKLASCLFAKENDMEGRLPIHWQPARAEGKVSNKVRNKRMKHSSARCVHGNMNEKDQSEHRRKPVTTRKISER